MSPAKDQEYFGEGLAEELIHALARIQGLRIVARTSAFALRPLFPVMVGPLLSGSGTTRSCACPGGFYRLSCMFSVAAQSTPSELGTGRRVRVL